MKSLQELYDEIMKDDALKKAFVEATKANKLMQFLKEQGCDVTEADLQEFLVGEEAKLRPLNADDLKAISAGSPGHTESVISQPCNHSVECTDRDSCSCTCIQDCC